MTMRCATMEGIPLLPRRPIPNDLAELGRIIREKRDGLDLSMGDVARFLRCNVARLSDLERGSETDPRYQWCDYCDVLTWQDCKRCHGIGYVPRPAGQEVR